MILDSLAVDFHLIFLYAGVLGVMFSGCRKRLSHLIALEIVNVRMLKQKAFTTNNICICSLIIAQTGDGITMHVG